MESVPEALERNPTPHAVPIDRNPGAMPPAITCHAFGVKNANAANVHQRYAASYCMALISSSNTRSCPSGFTFS
jgi:hypothetical protein